MHSPAAVTLGAGVQWHEAYDAIQAYDRLVVGGHSIGGVSWRCWGLGTPRLTQRSFCYVWPTLVIISHQCSPHN